MKVSNIILALAASLAAISCGGKSGSEKNVVNDSSVTAVVSLNSEYYFSGLYEFGNDTSFLTERATGRKLGVIGNKVTESLESSCDTLFGDVSRVELKARGYIREIVHKGDIHDCVYLTYVENVSKYGNETFVPLTGEYKGNGSYLKIEDDHTCCLEMESENCEGEWFMSNDTLLYMNLDSTSYIYDVHAGNDTIVNHKQRDIILVRQ